MADYSFKLGAQIPVDRCPHCGIAKPRLAKWWGPKKSTSHSGGNPRFWSLYRCSTCGGAVVAWAHQQNGRVQRLYPSARGPDSALPSRARRYLKQAMESLSAPSGAVMLAASAVDAMLKAKDYKEGSLYSRIDVAAEDNVITDEMAAWAHNVRLDANDERHADEDAELPKTEDAKRSVEFAEALGEFLFVLPARVERGRKEAEEADQDSE